MIVERYHCNDEMDLLGRNEQGYCFECRICGFREYSLDVTLPTTPEEVPRTSMTEYNLGGTISKNIKK